MADALAGAAVGLVLPMNAHAVGRSAPLISIITPYRDARRFLPGLVATLQAQTYRRWECLLVDHASSDGGGMLAAALTAGDPRFRHLKEADPRPLPALPRNRALLVAVGSLICFLDADDLWHPEKLERQLEFHRARALELSVTAYGRFGIDGAIRDVQIGPDPVLPRVWLRRCPPQQLARQQLWCGNPVPMLTVMVNRAVLVNPTLDSGPFSAVRHEDYLLWLQIWQRRPQLRYGCLTEVLAFHRRHGTNLTAQRWRSVLWTYRLYRAAGLGRFTAAAASARTGVIAMFRACAERVFACCAAADRGAGARATSAYNRVH